MNTPRPENWQLSLDDTDPLHADMLLYLRGIRKRGRYSPVRSILTRWAANGFLIELGRIAMASAADPQAIFNALGSAGLLSPDASLELVADALGALAEGAPQRSPTIDLDTVRKEIAAIESAASLMDFE